MKYVLGVLVVFLCYLLVEKRFDDKYQAGYRDGVKSSLKTNPPSNELEMTCAGLWIGEQNKRWFQKEMQ